MIEQITPTVVSLAVCFLQFWHAGFFFSKCLCSLLKNVHFYWLEWHPWTRPKTFRITLVFHILISSNFQVLFLQISRAQKDAIGFENYGKFLTSNTKNFMQHHFADRIRKNNIENSLARFIRFWNRYSLIEWIRSLYSLAFIEKRAFSYLIWIKVTRFSFISRYKSSAQRRSERTATYIL